MAGDMNINICWKGHKRDSSILQLDVEIKFSPKVHLDKLSHNWDWADP